jgi:hypothetical protein
MAEVVRQWVVPSFTYHDSRYLVRLQDNGAFDCTCMAFVMHPDNGDCKHITAVKAGKYTPMAHNHLQSAQVTISVYTWDCPNCEYSNMVSAFRVNHIHTDECTNCHRAFSLMK